VLTIGSSLLSNNNSNQASIAVAGNNTNITITNYMYTTVTTQNFKYAACIIAVGWANNVYMTNVTGGLITMHGNTITSGSTYSWYAAGF